MGTIQKNESLNYWREFFATAKNSSIFDVLDQAITLAASDFPEEFSRQRSRILGSIQGLGGGDDRRSDLGFGTGSETGSEQKAEPSKPSLKVRIKIVKRNVDGTLIKPSSDEAKPIKPSSDENKSIKPETCVDKVALDRAKMIKPPPCVGEPKSIKPIAKPYLDEAAFEAKLQATKRKFHDRYEEIENSKRQRRIQVLSYLPKQDFKIGCRPSTKPQGKKLGNHFLQASHRVNGVELRGCKIKYSDSDKGFGIFAANDVSDGVLLVVPLDLAITPMRVLQDPFFGPECRAMFEEGDVDDRFLMVLFLTVERLRKNSSWKPYLDMLPTTFGNPLWFTDDELLELKGTTLYRATELQKKSLRSLYDDKLKALVDKLLTLDGDSERDVCFEDFLWANSVFWARALNIPLPYSYVFPQVEEKKNCSASNDKSSDDSTNMLNGNVKGCQVDGVDIQVNGVTSVSNQKDTVWVEGLVPGIDFCNHGLKPAATWEVDGTGSITRVPFSMYLLSAGQPLETDEEISISYGNKGNEELLHLYGFVLDGNPDDYLMVHYPVQALQSVSFSYSKAQLLEAQKAEMRCLLPRSLLDHGFFPVDISTNDGSDEGQLNHVCSYSWSGQRKMPSYLNKLVFPESFLTTLRTVAMKEDELFQVSSLLEELVTSGGGRQPSDSEVRAAIWEACGDSGALQMLVDLLTMRMVDLQDGSGTEGSDTNLLKNARFSESPNLQTGNENDLNEEINGLQPPQSMSRNKWSSIVYRRGQKQLTRLFLKEAEHALQLALDEGN